MTPPVDNFTLGAGEPEGDLTPQLEALARLYELCERYSMTDMEGALTSYAARHRLQYGHQLRYGCCSGRSVKDIDPEPLPPAPVVPVDITSSEWTSAA